MMNRILQNSITVLFSIVLFSCAGESKDYNDDSSTSAAKTENSQQNEIFLELDKQLNELTVEQKEAFQLRAIQKFRDFTDYVKIISNQELDKDLKNHSSELALELFINDSILLVDTINNTPKEKPLHQYLNDLKLLKKTIYVSIDSIYFIAPLTIDSTDNYTGIIETLLKVNGHNRTKKIDVFITTVGKKFGDDKANINEVRLGNIY